MGARPLFALNIVGFPDQRLPMWVLDEILRGALDKAAEAGISIIGGHTVEDTEPKFGLAVTGVVNPDQVLRNNTARPGNALVLTKPLGLGIISTAVKSGLAEEAIAWQAAEVADHVTFAPGVSHVAQLVLADAQTSGGLLISLPEDRADAMLAGLRERGVSGAARIGRVTAEGKGRIMVEA